MSLMEFSTPEQVLSTGVEQIVVTWKKEVKRAVGIQSAVRLVEAAKISIGIKEGLKMAKKELEVNLEQYELYLKQNEQLEVEIEKLAFQVPGVKEMVSMKGVGILLFRVMMPLVSKNNNLKCYMNIIQIEKKIH